MGRLDGKVTLISGTARGMGRAAAVEFAAQGAAVFGCDLDSKASEETIDLVTAAGGTMAALAPVDLASADGARAWVDAAIAEFGGVDILYNNASALRNGPLPGILAKIPLGRYGHAHEVAKLAAFLASDDAAFITGAEIAIDGGDGSVAA